MRYLLPLLFSTAALAHPGHGKPGLFHFHEFSDGLLIGVALVAAVLVAWAWKK
jgi:hypothetical protein